MAQFLRPDSNVTQTSFTNGFANIDESSASDADFAYGANNTAAVLEVGMSNPASTPGSGTTTVRYRIAKTNSGAVDGGGNSVTVTCAVYQGTSLIASDSAQTATGTWTAYSFTPDMSSVTDWTDVRLRFTTSASGGSPANRRGGAVSWAEIEAPDAPAAVTHTATGTLTGQIGSVAGSAAHNKPHAATGSLTGQIGSLSGSASSATARPSSGALAGQGSTLAGSAARTRVHSASGVLSASGAVVSGAASRTGGAAAHDASGSLTGQAGTLSGGAARFRALLAQGSLIGAGSVLDGSASKGATVHDASGELVGETALAGIAALLVRITRPRRRYGPSWGWNSYMVRRR